MNRLPADMPEQTLRIARTCLPCSLTIPDRQRLARVIQVGGQQDRMNGAGQASAATVLLTMINLSELGAV